MTPKEFATPSDKSSSIIYSFKFRWFEEIQRGQVAVFFRKRGPRLKPARVFMYVGAPISSVVAVADIERIQEVDLIAALKLAELGRISRSELESYIEPSGTVQAIFLRGQRNLRRPLGVSELRRIFNFHPPQNFMQLSQEVEKKILEASSEKEAH